MVEAGRQSELNLTPELETERQTPIKFSRFATVNKLWRWAASAVN